MIRRLIKSAEGRFTSFPFRAMTEGIELYSAMTFEECRNDPENADGPKLRKNCHLEASPGVAGQDTYVCLLDGDTIPFRFFITKSGRIDRFEVEALLSTLGSPGEMLRREFDQRGMKDFAVSPAALSLFAAAAALAINEHTLRNESFAFDGQKFIARVWNRPN